MNNQQICRLQKQSKEGTISITVPKKFVDVLGWNAKDEIICTLHGEKVVLEKNKNGILSFDDLQPEVQNLLMDCKTKDLNTLKFQWDIINGKPCLRIVGNERETDRSN